jgi:hypothetical protein
MQEPEQVKEKAWVIAVTSGAEGLDVRGLDELNDHLARGYRVVRFERLSDSGAGEPALAFVVAAKRVRRSRK